MPALAARLRCLRPCALLTALCLLLYLPGIAAIPPLDRDEARFAQATRQMLETGDFLRIRFQDEARNRKPAGIYWLQAAAVDAFSSPAATAIWPYRLPSLLGAIIAVLATFALGAALFGDHTAPRRLGVAAGVLLGAALGLVAEAHIAKTDAALLAAATIGQGALGIAYLRARSGDPAPAWLPLLFWAAEIAAIFLKGPIGPALAAGTIATLWIADGEAGWLRGLRPLLGLAATVLAVAPWLIAIERATEGRFLADALGGDLFGKLIGVRELHGAPPFSYLLMALVSFWPGSLLLAPALVHAWQRHEAAPQRFLLAWLVPAWVLLELVPTKLPHYALPLYPALALLTAAALADGIRLPDGSWSRRVDLAVRALWLVVTLALAAALIALPLRLGSGLSTAGLLGAIAILALAAALLRQRPNPMPIAGLCAALAVAFTLPAATAALPGLDRLWLSRGAASLIARHPPPAGVPLVAVGYSEPSLVFLLGTDLRLSTPSGAAEMLAHGGAALVSSRVDAMFRQAIAARGLAAAPVGSVPGLDYSNGQRMVLTLYDVSPG